MWTQISVDLTQLLTPIQECVCLQTEVLEPRVFDQLDHSNYDQAPVRLPNGAVIGLIDTSRARFLMNSGIPLSEKDEGISSAHIASHPSLDVLLDTMAARRAVLVVDEVDTELGHHASCFGLLTISDLNKHYLRSVVYRLLAELESSLGMLTERRFPDPWAWLEKLPEDSQARLAGYWELAKRRNVDVGPIAGATLVDLLRIAGGTREIRLELGFSSVSQFEKVAGPLPSLRNRIMHPVRPMILDIEDVTDLRKSIESVSKLTEAISNRLLNDEHTLPNC